MTADKHICDYFRDVVQLVASEETRLADAKFCANFVIGEINKKRNEGELPPSKLCVQPDTCARLLTRVKDGTISLKVAKELFSEFWDYGAKHTGGYSEDGVDREIESRGLKQVTDASAIEKMVDDVISANPKSVEEYKAGKEKALNALFGQVMKASNKTANPTQVTEILKRKLSS